MKRARFSIDEHIEGRQFGDFLKTDTPQLDDKVLPSNLLKAFKLYIIHEAQTAELRQQVLDSMLLELQALQQESSFKEEKKTKVKSAKFNLSAWGNNPCPKCGHLVWVRLHRSFWQKLLHSYKKRCQCLKCHHEFWLG